MLRRKVSDAHALLPEGATTPIVKDDFGNVYGMFYALTGDGLSDRELSDYAELVKRGSERTGRRGPCGTLRQTFRMYQHLPAARPYGKPRC